MLSDIEKKENLNININNLINILATDEPFNSMERNNPKPTAEQIQIFCDRLIRVIISETIPWF